MFQNVRLLSLKSLQLYKYYIYKQRARTGQLIFFTLDRARNFRKYATFSIMISEDSFIKILKKNQTASREKIRNMNLWISMEILKFLALPEKFIWINVPTYCGMPHQPDIEIIICAKAPSTNLLLFFFLLARVPKTNHSFSWMVSNSVFGREVGSI